VPNISTTTLPNATATVAYSQPLVAAGGDGTLSWSIASGTLPTGLTLSSSGLIAGTPSLTGTFNFTVRIADSDINIGQADEDTQSLSIVVNAAPVTAMTFSVSSMGLIDGVSTAWEQARDVAIDDQGNIYIVGGTSSSSGFPVTSGAYDTTYNNFTSTSADTSYIGQSELGNQGPTDAFIVKLDPQGNVVWGTYLGGPNYDRAYAVEVDASHNVYVAGRAGRGFPTTANAVQPVFAGDSSGNGEYGKQDGFVAKLSADGAQLLWATYFGESAGGFIRDIDIDAQGRVHLVATNITATDMDHYVTAGAGQSTLRGSADSFYARLSATGSQVEYGSYLGGNDSLGAFSGNPSVRVLADGTAYVLVSDQGPGAPVTSGAYQTTYGGKLDLILARFSPVANGGKMDACTYLGGSEDDFMDTHHLALSPSGNPIVTAGTKSTNFPVTEPSVFNTTGKGDIAVSILSSDLTALLHSRVIGGSAGDSSEGIGVDAAGNIYITGSTGSSDLPVTSGALHATDIANEREGFLLVYSPDLSQLRYFSYDNIASEYGNRSSIVSSNGTWYVVGATWHMTPFPATAGKDATINGTYAAYFQILAPGQ